MNIGQAMNILGLRQGYSEDELKSVFRKLALKYHPDRTGGVTTKEFLEIKEAYEFLLKNIGNTKSNLLVHKDLFTIVVK